MVWHDDSGVAWRDNQAMGCYGCGGLACGSWDGFQLGCGLLIRPWVAMDMVGWLGAVGMGRCGCVCGRVHGSWLDGGLVRSATL